jgi:hypothetical protein
MRSIRRNLIRRHPISGHRNTPPLVATWIQSPGGHATPACGGEVGPKCSRAFLGNERQGVSLGAGGCATRSDSHWSSRLRSNTAEGDGVGFVGRCCVGAGRICSVTSWCPRRPSAVQGEGADNVYAPAGAEEGPNLHELAAMCGYPEPTQISSRHSVPLVGINEVEPFEGHRRRLP